MQLKDHLQRCLDKLGTFFRLTVQHGPAIAFMKETERPYREVPGLEGMPYVCLRVPTGGGKTFMAAHAVSVAVRELLNAERAVCLWLVPSNVIREQTLAALKDRQHPYRQALDVAFGGKVVVIDLADALSLSYGDASGTAVVLVSTLAALRVEDTDGRKVYESNGYLQPHFVGLDDALKAKLEKEGDGRVIYSLANVLRLRRPVVLMDEAHNARTLLSFDTLKRFTPSCVIEFTATPETKHNPTQGVFASNILHHVSARELKEAEMIKLPIKLRTRPDWKQVMADAIAKRKELEALADANEKATGEYLRPIMLIQAQAQNKNKPTLTVDVAKQTLMEEFQIPDDQIAIATGQTRGLEDVDLFGRCPIRFIITVQALKEGWDCSFAYVLCSLAEQHSAKSVEQILGRILRMPRAKKKSNPALNIAYAFAVSSSFIATAQALQDGLVENGFQALEAKDFVQESAGQPTFDEGLMFGTTTETVSEAPDLSALDLELRSRVTFDEMTKELTFTGMMAETHRAALQECFSTDAAKKAVERMCVRSQGRAAREGDAVAAREPIRVPWLSVRVGDQLELFDAEHYLTAPWDLAKCDFVLTDKEMPSSRRVGETGEIDITKLGKVELTHFVNDLHEQIALITGEGGWEVPTLARWIDRNIRHQDIPQNQSAVFIHQALSSLIDLRRVTVEQLARIKYPLRDAIEAKIALHRDAHRGQAFQSFLFGSDTGAIEVDPVTCFTFDEDRYAPNWYYEGSYAFKRAYFRRIGELDTKGEEYECAVFLDTMDEVKYWVRNLSRRPDSSFWLPTSTDRFYPDFVVLLKDGRILVVEYKGEDRSTTDDSKEKKAVGEMWAAKSGGRCLFAMPVAKDWQAISGCVGSRS